MCIAVLRFDATEYYEYLYSVKGGQMVVEEKLVLLLSKILQIPTN